MRKESITIRNFGPIREAVLEDIRPLTIIIGPSGSGKSTILKVVSLFRWLLKMMNIRSYLRRAGMKHSPFRLTFQTYIKRNGWTGFVSKETYIEYHFGEVEIIYQDGKLTNPRIKGELHLEKVSFIADSRIIIPDILALKARSDEFYTNETLEDFRLAMESLESVEIPFLGVRATTKKKEGKKVYQISGSDQPDSDYAISLDNSSSGTQTLLPIVAITEYYATKYDLVTSLNRAIFGYASGSDELKGLRFAENIGDIPSRRVSLMIEEPELSLSPEMQVALFNGLCRRCFTDAPKEYEMGVFITTHSPYIVNQLNLLILAGNKGERVDGAALRYEDVQVYRLSRESGLVSLKSVNREFIDAMPLSDQIASIYTQYAEMVKRHSAKKGEDD
jgi:predicted ATPase